MTLLARGKKLKTWHGWYTRAKRSPCSSIDDWHEPELRDHSDFSPEELKNITLCNRCFHRRERIEILGWDPYQICETHWYRVKVYRPARMIDIKVQAPDPETARTTAISRAPLNTFRERSDQKYIAMVEELEDKERRNG